MVKNTLQWMHTEYGTELVVANVTFPTNNDAILGVIRNALEDHGDIYLATFSHITSTPAIILPIKEIAELCHQYGVLVLVDGAHALGQIPLNVTDIDADFYVANGHKWLYTPKGSAFLWVRKDRQSLIYPTVISLEGTGKSTFQTAFSYEGTMDYSPFLSFTAGLDFRQSFGEDEIMNYMHTLAAEGGNKLASMWGTEKLVSDTMIGAMVNVRIPTNDTLAAQNLPRELLERHNTWVPTIPIQGQWYTRVSAQIYNDITDFEFLGRAILEVLNPADSTQ